MLSFRPFKSSTITVAHIESWNGPVGVENRADSWSHSAVATEACNSGAAAYQWAHKHL